MTYHSPIRSSLWRDFHDTRLCGGQMQVAHDPLRDVYYLTCMCGTFTNVEVTLREVYNGRRDEPCEVCGERTSSSPPYCPTCESVEYHLGDIVRVVKGCPLEAAP